MGRKTVTSAARVEPVRWAVITSAQPRRWAGLIRRRRVPFAVAAFAATVTVQLMGPQVAPAQPKNTAPAAQTSAGTSVTALSWKLCAPPSPAQCAVLEVPLDHRHPAGRTTRLAVARIPASGAQPPVGTLVINPGGPGLSATSFLLTSAPAVLSKQLRERFDLVAIDNRGTGASRAVRCLDDRGKDEYLTRPPFNVRSAADAAAVAAAGRRLAQGCTGDERLPYLSTTAAARDLDRLRTALGMTQLNYLGLSYGTQLGAVYSTLFPGRLRTMVLDGASNPHQRVTRPLSNSINRAAATEDNLRAFLAGCARQPQCTFGRGNPAAAFDRLRKRLRTTPQAGKNGRMLTETVLLSATTAAMESVPGPAWTELAAALAAAENGDATPLVTLADASAGRTPQGSYDTTIDGLYAVNCLDQRYPRDRRAWQTALRRADRRAPRLGVFVVTTAAAPCPFWTAPVGGPPVARVRATATFPVLVVGSTGDAATPYAGAHAMAQQLGDSVLLTRQGRGHLAYPYSSCVREHVDRYLLTGRTPAAGTRCATA